MRDTLSTNQDKIIPGNIGVNRDGYFSGGNSLQHKLVNVSLSYFIWSFLLIYFYGY